jgi:transcriptional regulator with XRE-family HTH domain
MSQPELAKRVPVPQSSLSRYESGRQAVDPLMAARLDDLLGADGELRALLPKPTADVLNADQRDRLAYSVEYPARIDETAISA